MTDIVGEGEGMSQAMGASVPDRAGGPTDLSRDASQPVGAHPSRVQPWPADNGPLSFEDIARPVLHAIRFAYDLKRRDRRRSIPWRGPEIDKRDQACSPTITERLQAKNLSYVEEDQGREALEEIITGAIQLGIAQGRRLARSDHSELLDDAYGAVLTIRIGWDGFASVHTQSGLLADPTECLRKGIEELASEMARVQRCPRHKAVTRDRDVGSAEDAKRLNPEGAAARPEGIAR